MGKHGFKTVKVTLLKTELKIYASQKLASAVEDIVKKATLYEGVKLSQIMEAVYLQGRKDGAREAFEQLDHHMIQVKKAVPHMRPGRPRVRKKI